MRTQQDASRGGFTPPHEWRAELWTFLTSPLGMKDQISCQRMVQGRRTRRFADLLTKQAQQVQQGKSPVIFSPSGKGRIVRGSARSEGLQSRQQKHAVRSDRKGRMARRGAGRAQLRLTDAQQTLLVAVGCRPPPAAADRAGDHALPPLVRWALGLSSTRLPGAPETLIWLRRVCNATIEAA
jgi:hypothetical protein